MKEGDKIFCISDDLLRKNKYYYFYKHDEILGMKTDCIYVKDEKKLMYYAPLSHFLTIKEERKLKLKEINERRR